MLEAVSDAEILIWGVIFGHPESMNDLDILEVSSFVDLISTGKMMPDLTWKVNRRVCRLCYYIVDGVYPKSAMFVDSI